MASGWHPIRGPAAVDADDWILVGSTPTEAEPPPVDAAPSRDRDFVCVPQTLSCWARAQCSRHPGRSLFSAASVWCTLCCLEWMGSALWFYGLEASQKLAALAASTVLFAAPSAALGAPGGVCFAASIAVGLASVAPGYSALLLLTWYVDADVSDAPCAPWTAGLGAPVGTLLLVELAGIFATTLAEESLSAPARTFSRFLDAAARAAALVLGAMLWLWLCAQLHSAATGRQFLILASGNRATPPPGLAPDTVVALHVAAVASRLLRQALTSWALRVSWTAFRRHASTEDLLTRALVLAQVVPVASLRRAMLRVLPPPEALRWLVQLRVCAPGALAASCAAALLCMHRQAAVTPAVIAGASVVGATAVAYWSPTPSLSGRPSLQNLEALVPAGWGVDAGFRDRFRRGLGWTDWCIVALQKGARARAALRRASLGGLLPRMGR